MKEGITMRKTIILSLFMLLTSITPINAKGPSLNRQSKRLYVGNHYTFTLKNTQKVSWRIKDPQIASITKKGVVTGLKAGTTSVVATCSGKHYHAKVIVLRSQLNYQHLYTYTGAYTRLHVQKLRDTKPFWQVSQKSFRLDQENGDCIIWSMKPGRGTISAQVKGETYTCQVTIRKALNYDDFYVKDTALQDGYNHYFMYVKDFGPYYYWYFNKKRRSDPADNRGIVMGSSLNALTKAYGASHDITYFKTKAALMEDRYALIPSGHAYMKVTYSARINGEVWYKMFYFDAQKKVNGIVWTTHDLVLSARV